MAAVPDRPFACHLVSVHGVLRIGNSGFGGGQHGRPILAVLLALIALVLALPVHLAKTDDRSLVVGGVALHPPVLALHFEGLLKDLAHHQLALPLRSGRLLLVLVLRIALHVLRLLVLPPLVQATVFFVVQVLDLGSSSHV